MDYIQTLNIGDGEGLNRVREGKERAPPDIRPAKKRALVIYGKGDTNAWDTPLLGDNETTNNTKEPAHRSDLTKDGSETSASTDTISQLTQDLAF